MKTRFVVITDTHYNIPGSTDDFLWWNRFLVSRIEEISNSMVSTIRSLSPDFLIHCGDFTNDSKLEHFQYGLDVMEACGCPYYLTFGNHDGYLPDMRKNIAPMIGMEDGKLYYSSEMNGMRFYFLDPVYWMTDNSEIHDYLHRDVHREKGYVGGGPLQEELTWLRDELGRYDNDPSFLITHMPIFSKSHYPVGRLHKGEPVPESPYPIHKPGTAYCLHDEELREITRTFPHLRMVFTGHWHIHDLVSDDGVYHCQTASMIEYPLELRLMEHEGNSLTSTIVPLDNPRLAAESVVEEWGNTWVHGTPEDREFKLGFH